MKRARREKRKRTSRASTRRARAGATSKAPQRSPTTLPPDLHHVSTLAPELGVHVGLKRTAGAAAGCPLAVLVRFCWHASVWERLQEAAHILNGSVTSCSVRWTDSPESAWAHEDWDPWARVREAPTSTGGDTMGRSHRALGLLHMQWRHCAYLLPQRAQDCTKTRCGMGVKICGFAAGDTTQVGRGAKGSTNLRWVLCFKNASC